jgi:NDP-sugar pyrophosphorylase family protein
MAEGLVTGETYDGLWFDIGTRERLDELNNLLAQ